MLPAPSSALESNTQRGRHGQALAGILEGTASLIQAAKRKARGYRTKRNLITMIYLIAGRLPLPSTHTI